MVKSEFFIEFCKIGLKILVEQNLHLGSLNSYSFSIFFLFLRVSETKVFDKFLQCMAIRKRPNEKLR